MDPTLGDILLGFIVPPIVAFFQRLTANNRILNFITSVIVVLVITALKMLLAGQIDIRNINTSNFFNIAGTIFIAAQASYNIIWKQSGVTDRIEGGK